MVPSATVGSQSLSLFIKEASTVRVSLFTISQNQPKLITCHSDTPKPFPKAYQLLSVGASKSYQVFSVRLLEDVTLRKGEMCLAQARVIHSRHMCNAGETGANNWTSCQQATGIAFDILIVSWSMHHTGSITVIADCTSVNLFQSLLMCVWVREKPDITRHLNWAWLLPFPFSCRRTWELTNANDC
jgi:hypothetical protein